ncbi:hypothetical protein DAEQUDRAFT_765198 [Daedalea quercina L-15889]|uniref:IRG-type G domain-containing protein n=1 Tax=Daedalea quercina L-15889 TaxID=1314783 RepID=A0A165QST9_9APHY|nr:hypothetical protein DAEQUDRAFT_765198 [Daedalea quercina L-15889]
MEHTVTTVFQTLMLFLVHLWTLIKGIWGDTRSQRSRSVDSQSASLVRSSDRQATHPTPLSDDAAAPLAFRPTAKHEESIARESHSVREDPQAIDSTKGGSDEALRSVAEVDPWEAKALEQRGLTDLAKAFAEAQAAKEAKEESLRALLDAQSTVTNAHVKQEEAERGLRQGIRPVISPTDAEIRATKERLDYKEGSFHVAIAGVAGSGKSSLVNAFRGLRNSDKGAAPTGVVETTDAISWYPDPSSEYARVWYDVPGAGTLSVPDWLYFTDQGLYVFDCIVVLFDIRLTATDIAILLNAARFRIPTYLVRSKALQHIRNLAADMSDDDTGPLTLARARERYIQDTRASVARNLQAAGLLEQRAYLVDKDTLVKIVKGRVVKNEIDDSDLLQDLIAQARRHRVDELA